MNTQLGELVWSAFDLPAKGRRKRPEQGLWELIGRFWRRNMHRDIKLADQQPLSLSGVLARLSSAL